MLPLSNNSLTPPNKQRKGKQQRNLKEGSEKLIAKPDT
jgi:hypothetical protein